MVFALKKIMCMTSCNSIPAGLVDVPGSIYHVSGRISFRYLCVSRSLIGIDVESSWTYHSDQDDQNLHLTGVLPTEGHAVTIRLQET